MDLCNVKLIKSRIMKNGVLGSAYLFNCLTLSMITKYIFEIAVTLEEYTEDNYKRIADEAVPKVIEFIKLGNKPLEDLEQNNK